MLITNEMWKTIEGYNGDYEVSSFGRVKSGKRGQDKILKLFLSYYKYPCVNLCAEGKMTQIAVHRLVAKAFLDKSSDHTEVNHTDGNKQNNHIHNLEWVTSSENTQHAYDIGLCKKGQSHYKAKLTQSQVHDIRKLCNYGDLKHIVIANYYNVSNSTISHIKNKRNWK